VRGSGAGAVRQQLGKFELASGGTLFLDEIGDLRIDLQAKLLRAVNGGEIERVGGARTVRGYRENQFHGRRVAYARNELRLGRSPRDGSGRLLALDPDKPEAQPDDASAGERSHDC